MRRRKWWRSGPPRKADNLKCAQCTKTFYRSPANRSAYSHRGTHDYCGRECMAASFRERTGKRSVKFVARIIKPCEHCGRAVARPPWAAHQNARTFCDRACFGKWKADTWNGAANPAWSGGHPPYYGMNWKRQQRATRRRDDHTCQLCRLIETKSRRALDVHHIRPFRFFSSTEYRSANKLANLITLCSRCHTKAERRSRAGTILSWSALRSQLSHSRITQR